MNGSTAMPSAVTGDIIERGHTRHVFIADGFDARQTGRSFSESSLIVASVRGLKTPFSPGFFIQNPDKRSGRVCQSAPRPRSL